MGLKTGDVNLDLQGQIGLDLALNNFVRFLVNATTFGPFGIFSFKHELCIIDLKISNYFKNWLS